MAWRSGGPSRVRRVCSLRCGSALVEPQSHRFLRPSIPTRRCTCGSRRLCSRIAKSGSPTESEAPEGFIPVLTCGCTVYGCGGSYARIRFKADTVERSDFHNQLTDKPVRVGPFFFERSQYENARRAFAPNPVRRSGVRLCGRSETTLGSGDLD